MRLFISHKSLITKRLHRKQGLTLIEVLIVVAILALLVLIAFNFLPQLAKGKDGKRKSDLAQLKIALEDYYNDYQCYPSVDKLRCDNPEGLRPYLAKVPCDPKGTSYLYEVDPGYDQAPSPCPRWFRIYTNLENPSDPETVKVGCTVGCGPYSAVPPPADLPYQYGVSSDNIRLEAIQSFADCLGGLVWICQAGNCVNIPHDSACGVSKSCYCTKSDCENASACE